MSGTSVDGIDAALVEITGEAYDLQVRLLAARTYPYSSSLRHAILQVAGGGSVTLASLDDLDDLISGEFARAALEIQAGQPAANLIGSHGQTLLHRPPSPGRLGFSYQAGRGAQIAALTGIDTVSNFRAADLALGGQGAPLVPAVDACLLGSPYESRCIQNLGGIGNVTYIPRRGETWLNQVQGWDTGPANILLDLAVRKFSGGRQTYDQDGAWASTGTVCQPLVQKWLAEDFFQQPPPRSTGRERFGAVYLETCLQDAAAYNLTPADCLATLTELTVQAVLHSYTHYLPQIPEAVFLSGGGSRNRYLHRRLASLLDPVPVRLTDELGWQADFREAIAFAVLAYWYHQGVPGNLPRVTGARSATVLGELHVAGTYL